MWFRQARRTLFRPITKRFERTFAFRSDTGVQGRGLAEQSRAIERFEGRLDEIGRQIETLSLKLQETNLQIGQQTETLSGRIDHEIRPQIGQITAHLDQLASSLARADGKISRGMTDRVALGHAITRLETGTRFDRQAIHDIAHRIFGGGEPVNGEESSVGIVISTCDRPDSLWRALNSIAAQSRKRNYRSQRWPRGHQRGRGNVLCTAENFSDQDCGSLQWRVDSPQARARCVGHRARRFLDDDNLMWPRWIERAAGFLEGDPKIDISYGAQLRDAEPSTTSKSWFFLPFDFEALKKSNFVDLNQIVHRSSDIRFDQALRRLVDWDYVLRLIGSDPTRIVPVDAIASIYSISAPRSHLRR
jgi:hypothetical protein